MKPFTKTAVYTGAGMLVLAVAAQLDLVSLSYARLGSWTHNSDAVRERHGDLVAEVHIERPFWRWLPFVKVGDTVYHHSYQYAQDPKTVLERDSTTQTHLWVIGLCSTRRYDELADAPYEKVHREYLKR